MTIWKRVVAGLVALVLASPLPLLAQEPPPLALFPPEELEQIAAPIALYSDPLLAQVLMAATYPLEVVQAARFVQGNPTLQGAPLNDALKAQNWDDSVKALTLFPQVLNMMNDRLDWTQKLGDAFLGQQADLMDAVQRLRARAQAQGTLTSTPQQTVTVDDTSAPPIVQIEPTQPDMVYVPVYNPLSVYGPWPYAAYPPYYYYPAGWPAVGAFFSFGFGIAVGAALWGGYDWHRHHVVINTTRYNRFTRNVNVESRWGQVERRAVTLPAGGGVAWQHDVQHRLGVQYRTPATQQRFGRTPPQNVPAREPFRGRPEQGQPNLGRPEQARPEQARGPAVPRPEAGRSQPPSVGRSQGSPAAAPAAGQRREPGAFQGLGSSGNVNADSNRGRESRQNMSRPSPAVRSAPAPSARPPSVPPRSAPSGGARPGGGKQR
jgi:hypothetical protein